LADSPRRFGDARDAGLGVGAHRLTRKPFGERKDALHLLMDLARYALEEELGQ
jgi:hypothetical protein